MATGTLWHTGINTNFPNPGVCVNTDVTVTKRTFPANVVVVLNVKTNCQGQFTVSTTPFDVVYASMGKWILSGGVYVLDTPDVNKDGPPCPLTTGTHFLPPNQSGTTTLSMIAGRIADASVSSFTNASTGDGSGVKATLTDACGHSFAGTTNGIGLLISDTSPGASDLSVVLFDWSNIATVALTHVPHNSAYHVGPHTIPANHIYPSIDPAIYALCLCGPIVTLIIDLWDEQGEIVAPTATNPSNLHHARLAHYGRFAATPSGIQFWRSDFAQPGFALSAVQVSTVTTDSDPHGFYDEFADRLHCFFSRSGGDSGAISDDNGETWEAVTSGPGSFPRGAVDIYTGDILTAGYSAGNILTSYQGLGDTTGSATTQIVDETNSVIMAENDSFDLVRDVVNSAWYGVWRVVGSGNVSLWQSDDGVSWKKQYDCLPGCTRPRLALDYVTNEMLITGYNGGILQGVYQPYGATTPGDVFTLQDDGGTALSVQDTSHDISKATDDVSGEWTLTVMIAGDTNPSEWTSGNVDGSTWKKIV